jgi:hypothetical protein
MTLLDGDVCTRTLSGGIGLSKEDRDAGTLRMAGEILMILCAKR